MWNGVSGSSTVADEWACGLTSRFTEPKEDLIVMAAKLLSRLSVANYPWERAAGVGHIWSGSLGVYHLEWIRGPVSWSARIRASAASNCCQRASTAEASIVFRAKS